MVRGVDHHGQKQPLGVGARKARVAVLAPLHRRPHPVAIAQVDVVSHADFIAIVDDRRAGQGQQQAVQQFHLAAIVPQQRRQTPPDAQIDPRPGIFRIRPVHVVPFFVGDHLQRQLVVVSQKDAPLTVLRNRRRLFEDVDDRKTIFPLDRHEQPRHQGKVEIHVAFIAVPEVRRSVFRPLIRLGQQHLVGILFLDMAAQRFQKGVGLRQVLAVRALALVQVRHGVQTHPVHPQVQPEVDRVQHRLVHGRIVEIQIGLVVVEAMPVVSLGQRIPGPIRGLEILEDDAGFAVPLGRVAPDVEVAPRIAGLGPPRFLKPLVLVRRVIHDDLGDHPQIVVVGFAEKSLEIAQRAIRRVDPRVITDAIAIVPQRGHEEGQQPDRRDAEILDVVQLFGQARKVPDTVLVGIEKRAHVQLIENGILEPQRIAIRNRSDDGHRLF